MGNGLPGSSFWALLGYLDPGIGSIVFQVFVAGILSFTYFLTRRLAKLTRWLRHDAPATISSSAAPTEKADEPLSATPHAAAGKRAA